ncbi:hypothetical protein E2C01_068970 [Portunus trituberculatus]|uniref:Uncharacterized protein n=1 Tax=Portunus trituberculatus TaxID=210409 RepID=A0A5B7I1K7_PORTR|nr:hypothetical protein [Portunus trituberculatus]
MAIEPPRGRSDEEATDKTEGEGKKTPLYEDKPVTTVGRNTTGWTLISDDNNIKKQQQQQ